ncbi:group III truncated hemoglobin [Verrucomicrobiales bacterium]|jgi:hemoglobin|nr:group III truncated hemoglobin [Verrucomicrobiales bacterium]|tara:strand:- start:537 stop:950 length:414 start_codon:yes stop_codon:yes gene_type:complete
MEKTDIEGRAELEILVNDFYSRVRDDLLIGPVFDEVAKVDWTSHIPKIVDFWETVLFRRGAYRGSPLHPHLALSEKTEMTRERFERWLELFDETIYSRFAGERSEHLKRIAADMGEVMLSTDSGVFKRTGCLNIIHF